MIVVAALGLGFVRRAAPAPVPPLPDEAQVVSHLEQTIDWFRLILQIQQQPGLAEDVVARDRLQDASTSALRLSFDFARAEATLSQPTRTPETGSAPTSGGSHDQNLDRAAARLEKRVAEIQSRMKDVDDQLKRAPSRTRDALTAERGELAQALALTKEVQSTVARLAQFAATGAMGAAGGILGQIERLERSVPEARHPANAISPGGSGTGAASDTGPVRSSASAEMRASVQTEPTGLFSIVAELFTLGSARRQMDDAIGATDDLAKEVDAARGPLAARAREFMREAEQAESPVTDASQAATTRQDLEAAVVQFRSLSRALLPLAEQGIAMQTSRGLVVAARNRVSGRFEASARRALVRAAALAIVIAALLIVSDIWKRATFRYLRDPRRRRQFLVLRRVLLFAGIALVIVMGFVSEIGSLATYAGFVTAGIALALQNVILAVVAYFFLIGRYGVRVGDRITLAGVTGRVIDLGLVRLYLMELAGPELRSTGRVVVLSNAVLFQPAALFKQVPGTDYVWHTITATIGGEHDPTNVESRINAAIDPVYEGYRPAIEEQHANLQRFVEVETASPGAEVRSRLIEAGLECVIRYPVDPRAAADIDRRMLAVIREAVLKEPKLAIVSLTGPALQQAA